MIGKLPASRAGSFFIGKISVRHREEIMVEYRVLDLENDPRKEHFRYFSAMESPYVGVTVQVDITDFIQSVRAGELPFFLSFLYCAGRAVNAVPHLRRRILDGQVVEFSQCDTSHTVLRENGTYSYCRACCMQPFEAFLAQTQLRQARAKEAGGLDDGEDAVSLIFVSSLPWLPYTDLRQPTPVPADSNPRVTWGQYHVQQGRMVIPVTLLANHALVDGIHLAGFYRELDGELRRFSTGKG